MNDLASSDEVVAVLIGDEYQILHDRERGEHRHLASVYADDGDLVIESHAPASCRSYRLAGRESDLYAAGDPRRVAELVARFALLRAS